MSGVLTFAGSIALVLGAWSASPSAGLLASGVWAIWVAGRLERN